MKLCDALAIDRIELSLTSSDRDGAIRELIEMIGRSVQLPDPGSLIGLILEQEAVKTSGVDQHVAIPHARSDDIEGVVAALGISGRGIDFQSLDGQPVHLIFLILSSETSMPAYMSVLSRTARIFEGEEIRRQVLGAASADEIMEIIRTQEPF
ncbi:MAG: PTS sugar transporter subunit IIA [Candidatus Latescibacteria bacterium]|nr:PTS sugar transporter subunit IIA [Candidatus Latescibacterota bacterium]